MYIESWILVSSAITFGALLLLLWRLGKQVRALRFCFLHFSDWAHRQMSENRDYLVEKYRAENLSTDITKFERQWAEELKYTDQVIERAGLTRLSNADKWYALED